MAMNPNRTQRPQFNGCPFGCLDWTTCPHSGNGGTAHPKQEKDDVFPPEAGHRRTKELSSSPRAVWQRKREQERSQRRRDALKRLREEV